MTKLTERGGGGGEVGREGRGITYSQARSVSVKQALQCGGYKEKDVTPTF